MSQPLFVLSFAAAFGAAIAALIARLARVNCRAVRVVVLAAVASIVGASAVAIFGSRLRVNFTPSMPLGIYRLEPLPAAGVVRGMVVAVCAPGDAADLGRHRGYLATGPCPHDSELLLKVVAGVPGDDVAVSAEGVAIDGCLLPDSRPIAHDRAGRRVSPWPVGNYHLGRGEVWLYAGNPRSWDSRYWGPAPVMDVLARAVPLLVVPTHRSLYEAKGCGAALAPQPRPHHSGCRRGHEGPISRTYVRTTSGEKVPPTVCDHLRYRGVQFGIKCDI